MFVGISRIAWSESLFTNCFALDEITFCYCFDFYMHVDVSEIKSLICAYNSHDGHTYLHLAPAVRLHVARMLFLFLFLFLGWSRRICNMSLTTFSYPTGLSLLESFH